MGAREVESSEKDLLERLSTATPDAAWREFLERFSPLIMHVVRRYVGDQDRARDCFHHVRAALGDNGFKRLLGYRVGGPATFRTWLMAVVANLCVDWQRKQRGRFRPVRAVARLPELDQLVYRYIYVRGMARLDCLRALQASYPDLTEQQLSVVNARLFALLTPQQRWQLGTRMAATGPQGEGWMLALEEGAFEIEEPGPGPDEIAQIDQDRARLQSAMAQLPSQQRLLLRLRFEQNLTLAEVARLTRLSDPFRAKRQIQTALAALADLMKRPAPGAWRKKP